jgi:20S proteasome alpha/beta subunit
MTVGVGFLCQDGVVLCSDRQMTCEGFKFEESKIFHSYTSSLRFIFSYAGDPDAAKVMFRKVRLGLREKFDPAKQVFPTDKTREIIEILEKIFFDETARGLQTLIGISADNWHPILLRTQDMNVVDGYVEHIGLGDSSALRFLASFLTQEANTVDEATVLGSYIISVANRYVNNCGGGPDVTVLRNDGGVSQGSGGIFPDQEHRFLHCEAEIGSALRKMLIAGGRKRLDVTDFPVIEVEGVDLDLLLTPQDRERNDELLLCNGDKLQGHLRSGEVAHHVQ